MPIPKLDIQKKGILRTNGKLGELFNGIRAATSENSKFASSKTLRAQFAAEIAFRNGAESIGDFRDAVDGARKYPIEDSGLVCVCVGGATIAKMARLSKLPLHIPPDEQEISGGIRFTELDTLKALENYAPKLTSITPFPLTDQEMVRWVKKEVYVDIPNDPPSIRTWCQRFPNPTGCLSKATIHLRGRNGLATLGTQRAPFFAKNSPPRPLHCTSTGSFAHLIFAMIGWDSEELAHISPTCRRCYIWR